MQKKYNSYDSKVNNMSVRLLKEWDEVTRNLRKYFSSDKSTVKEKGGKSGRNGSD